MADTLPISPRAYGYDPSWFTGERILTQGERLQQARDAWRAKNPNAPYMPSDADLGYMYSNYEELFPGQLMTQEGSKAYTDLVDKLDKKDQLNSLLTTAGLAALPFAASAFMAPASGAAGGVSSLAGVAPELTAPLSTVGGTSSGASTLGSFAVPELGAFGGGAAGTAGTIGSTGVEGLLASLGSVGAEAPGLMGSLIPELTAPMAGMGSAEFFSLTNPVFSANPGLPSVSDYALNSLQEVGAPVERLQPPGDLRVKPGVDPSAMESLTRAIPSLSPSWADTAGDLLKSVGGKAVDFATSPGGIASLIGAAAGAAGGGGDKTATTQSRTDPRMDPYIYGTGFGDPNSILGAAFNQFKANPTGINPTMQQGLDMQRSALLDPKYAQGYQQMRDFGASLLSGFGQSPTVQPGGGLVTDRTKALMARGQSLLG